MIDGDTIVYTIGFASQKTIHQVVDSDEEGLIHYENVNKDLALTFLEDNPHLGEVEMSSRIEVSPKEHAFRAIKNLLQKIAEKARADSYKIFISGKGNFREDLATIQGYKHNRLGKPKPILYDTIREYLLGPQKATLIEGMEADDALSIVFTRGEEGTPVNVSKDPDNPVMKVPEKCIIAAIDKDLRNVPGRHINFDKRVADKDGAYKFVIVTEEEGRDGFYKQLITGDSADNILGIPGAGAAKADKVFADCISERDYFLAAYSAYKFKYGLDPFEYLHWSAYEDSSKAYSKLEPKDPEFIKDSQRLTGTALSHLIENARLLWMLREMPKADGSHMWNPPLSMEEIAAIDQAERDAIAEKEALKQDPIAASRPANIKPLTPWSAGRGKWFYEDEEGTVHSFKNEKKARSSIVAQKVLKLQKEKGYTEEEQLELTIPEPKPKKKKKPKPEKPAEVVVSDEYNKPWWDKSFE